MKSWKQIPRFTKYAVSDSGEVKNIDTGKLVVHGWSGRDGYRYKAVRVIEDGKTYRTGRKSIVIHKLVYETFVGPIPEGYQVDHIDRDNLNNRVDNLRAVPVEVNQNNRDVSAPIKDYSVFCEVMYGC